VKESVMDQDEGHHAITRQAVHELFQSLPAGATIRGLTENQYFKALDDAQAHQDRWYGPTAHPAWLSPDAQREHAMADPHRTAQENLTLDRAFIIGEISSARSADSGRTEMRHLSAAVHALQDSYSGAHMWRADSVHAGDPQAPIQSINVFDPGGFATNAPPFSEGTHNHHFDRVPLDDAGNVITGPANAAVAATASLLKAYEAAFAAGRPESDGGLSSLISGFLQPAPDGVKLNTDYQDPAWRHERDRRLEIEHGQGLYGHTHPVFDGGGGSHGHSGFESGAGGTSGQAPTTIGYVSPESAPVSDAGTGLSSPANATVSYPDGTVGYVDPSGHGQVHDPGGAADFTPADANYTNAQGLPEHISYDPGHDASGAASYDPGHDASGAASYDPGHDASGAASYDPGHDASGATYGDPGP
jgi:hypothetical protein